MIKGIAGLYLHIPFCKKKCAYCDFYSAFLNKEMLNKYADALINSIEQWGGTFHRPIDTIYFGGGTPSLLNDRLPEIVSSIKSSFNILSDAEITLELNPSSDSDKVLHYAKTAGVNRISIGAQSGINSELDILGRTHTAEDTINTVNIARNLGFDNISLDIMLGLPNSNKETLAKSLEFISNLKPDHISAYILKIEENTLFAKNMKSLNLPDDDNQASQYLQMCNFFGDCGYEHYEISNFCLKNKQSRHNLKYWKGVEYLGIGAAAHSFIDGKRFYYSRSIKDFTEGKPPISDGIGGGKEEYIMLSLRLKDGININEFSSLFGIKLPKSFLDKCILFEKSKLMKCDENSLCLTERGMLLSNSIINELLECF